MKRRPRKTSLVGSPCRGWMEVSVSNRGESHKARGTLVRGGVCCLERYGEHSLNI